MLNRLSSRLVAAATALSLCWPNSFSFAQQSGAPLTKQQCSDAMSIALAIVERNKGRISAGLIDSFSRFGKSGCDLNTDWKLTGKNDEDAFAQFRVQLIAMRK